MRLQSPLKMAKKIFVVRIVATEIVVMVLQNMEIKKKLRKLDLMESLSILASGNLIVAVALDGMYVYYL
jgi:hypothetical protein